MSLPAELARLCIPANFHKRCLPITGILLLAVITGNYRLSSQLIERMRFKIIRVAGYTGKRSRTHEIR